MQFAPVGLKAEYKKQACAQRRLAFYIQLSVFFYADWR